MIAEAEQTIAKMEQMKHADQSDICTLRGFLYMVRIVQNPAQNGQRYYIDVMQNYEKALKLNPDNQLAKQLQQKFFEGMKQQTKPWCPAVCGGLVARNFLAPKNPVKNLPFVHKSSNICPNPPLYH